MGFSRESKNKPFDILLKINNIFTYAWQKKSTTTKCFKWILWIHTCTVRVIFSEHLCLIMLGSQLILNCALHFKVISSVIPAQARHNRTTGNFNLGIKWNLPQTCIVCWKLCFSCSSITIYCSRLSDWRYTVCLNQIIFFPDLLE